MSALPDEAIQSFDPKQVRLRIFDMDNMLVIEGSDETFRFLAAMFQAMADSGCDDFWLGPDGPGQVWFDPSSRKGLYLNHERQPLDPDSVRAP